MSMDDRKIRTAKLSEGKLKSELILTFFILIGIAIPLVFFPSSVQAQDTVTTELSQSQIPNQDPPVSYPNYSNAQLNAVAKISTNDIWAVGSYTDFNTSTDRTLTKHWDGTQWNIIPSANVGSGSNYLTGVSVVSANDVRAVGYTLSNDGQVIIEHWDGNTWTISQNISFSGG